MHHASFTRGDCERLTALVAVHADELRLLDERFTALPEVCRSGELMTVEYVGELKVRIRFYIASGHLVNVQMLTNFRERRVDERFRSAFAQIMNEFIVTVVGY